VTEEKDQKRIELVKANAKVETIGTVFLNYHIQHNRVFIYLSSFSVSNRLLIV
jgi:hypothetical protein